MGRKAYGAHRTITLEQQARNIAESMRLHPGRTLADYGLTDGELAQMVETMMTTNQR